MVFLWISDISVGPPPGIVFRVKSNVVQRTSLARKISETTIERKKLKENWLVLWNHGILWLSNIAKNHPNWRTPSFFRGVGIPPTRKKSYDFPIGFSNEVQVLERVPLIFAFHKHGSFTLRARPGIARGTDKNWGQRYPRQTKISPDRFGGFHVSSTPILGVKLPYKFPCPFWWL